MRLLVHIPSPRRDAQSLVRGTPRLRLIAITGLHDHTLMTQEFRHAQSLCEFWRPKPTRSTASISWQFSDKFCDSDRSANSTRIHAHTSPQMYTPTT
eukprot:m.180768 g.180768  ORF g.180768 m.180768 type:complete len:97 (+) comp14952_c2_seq3:1390-1680(+)